MKKIVVLALVGMMVSMVGCSTSGPVIGPFSYMVNNSNQEKIATRAVIKSNIPAEKKETYIRAMALNNNDGQSMAVGVGVDLLAVYRETPTAGEITMQSGAALVDAVLEYLGGQWIYKQVRELNVDSKEDGTVNLENSNDNTINVINGDGNSGNNNPNNSTTTGQ